MPEEIWKDVVGYEGLYEVSNYGRVKAKEHDILQNYSGKQITKRRSGKELKPNYDCKGYLNVCLRKNGISKKCKVHRLVAMAFIPNENNFTQVNHKDEVKDNNYVGNLEWCTAKYNANFGTRIERRKATLKKRLETDPNYHDILSNRTKKLWQDPNYRQRMEKARQLSSEKMKLKWEEPEFRKRMTEGARERATKKRERG